MVKGPALAGPSERSERLEAFVRPGLLSAIAATTQEEKADDAGLKSKRDKLIVTVSEINQILLIMLPTINRIGDAML